MTMRSRVQDGERESPVRPSMRAWPNDHAERRVPVRVLLLVLPSMRAWPNDHAERLEAAHGRAGCRPFNEGMAE